MRICHTLPLTACLFVTIILLECPITSQRAMHRKPINPLHRRGQIIRLPWEIRQKLKGRASQFRRSDQIKAEAISGNGDGGGSLAAGPKSFEPAELAEQESGESSRRSDQIKPKAKSAAENQRGGAAQIQAEAESRSRGCETDLSLTPAPSLGGCPSSGVGPESPDPVFSDQIKPNADHAEQESGEGTRRSYQIKAEATSVAEKERSEGSSSGPIPSSDQIKPDAKARSRACETDLSPARAGTDPSFGGASGGMSPESPNPVSSDQIKESAEEAKPTRRSDQIKAEAESPSPAFGQRIECGALRGGSKPRSPPHPHPRLPSASSVGRMRAGTGWKPALTLSHPRNPS